MYDFSYKKSFWNTVFILFASVIALGISLFLYIYWFISIKKGLMGLVHRFNITNEEIFAPETFSVILILSLLVSLILLGLSVIYIYFQKMFGLLRLQKNFIRGFTHELKTPVTSIQLYIDTFSKYELDRDSQLKYLSYMQKDVKRLSSQIQRILNLARLEGKTDYITYENTDICSFISDIWDSYPNIKKDLTLNIEDKKVFLDIDPGLFEMLIINIFNNAIKYNLSPTPLLKVSFVKKGRKVNILFLDNGIGLKRRDTKKIFKQFYQVAKIDKKGGTGLGLYLSQMIAKKHKGKLYAESEGVNKGTTIILSLKGSGIVYEKNSFN